jgi:ribonuclease HI
MPPLTFLLFDGACRGNPGDSGAGACLQAPTFALLWHGWRYLGYATNNQAEYEGLIIGLSAALERGYTNLVVNGDSEVIIGQMQGTMNCRSPNLLVRQLELANNQSP